MKLIIEDDEGRRTVVPFVRDELTIGRNEDSAIRLSEKNVSRRHGRFVREDDRFFVEDLDSFTGIRVNGEKIAGRRLVHEGDLIQIGEYDLTLQAAPEERVAEPALVDDEELAEVGHQPDELAAQEGQAPLQPEMFEVPAQAQPASGDEAPADPDAVDAGVPETAQGPREAAHASGLPHAPAGSAAAAEAEAAARKSAVTAVIRPSGVPADPAAGEPALELPPQKRPRLVGIVGSWRARELLLERSPISIGRSDENDVSIDHPSISRRHCRLHLEGESWKVMDAESRNGVRVNGEPYAAIALRNGDVVEIGHLRFLFVTAGSPLVLPPEHGNVRAAALLAAQAAGGGDRRLVIGLGAALALSVGVAVFFAARHHRAAGGDASEVAQDSAAERRFALRAAGKALAGHRFAEALRDLDLARSAGAAASELRSYDQTQAEARSEELYREMEGAMAAQDYDRARKLLGVLSGSPTYYGQRAAEKADAITAGYVTLHLAAAVLMKGKDDAGCLSEAQVALAANPRSIDAQSLIASCKGGPAAAVQPPVPPAPARSPRPSRPTTPPPLPAVAVARMGASEGAGADARKLVTEGDRLLLAMKVPAAIATFQKALALKPGDAVLSRVYRSMGIAYSQQGNSEEGARYYKLYLPLCANPVEKAQLQKFLDDYEARRP